MQQARTGIIIHDMDDLTVQVEAAEEVTSDAYHALAAARARPHTDGARAAHHRGGARPALTAAYRVQGPAHQGSAAEGLDRPGLEGSRLRGRHNVSRCVDIHSHFFPVATWSTCEGREPGTAHRFGPRRMGVSSS